MLITAYAFVWVISKHKKGNALVRSCNGNAKIPSQVQRVAGVMPLGWNFPLIRHDSVLPHGTQLQLQLIQRPAWRQEHAATGVICCCDWIEPSSSFDTCRSLASDASAGTLPCQSGALQDRAVYVTLS